MENVAALLSRGLDRVLGTLAAIGFDAEWDCVPAAAVGAPHIRDRVFVIAHRSGTPCRVSDTDSDRIREFRQRERLQHDQSGANESANDGEDGQSCPDANSPRLEEWQRENASGARAICGSKSERNEWWQSEPDVGRVADGVPKRVDRLRGLGNAVVPQVAEYIGHRVVDVLRGRS